MTNRPLILGAVAAACMAAGQATAAPCTDGSIVRLNAPGFTCTLGDTTLSDFSSNLNTTQLTNNRVEFSVSGSTETVVFVRVGNNDLGTGGNLRTFNFDVTVDPAPAAQGTTLSEYVVAARGTTAMGGTQFTSNATITGDNTPMQTASGTNPFQHTFALNRGDTSAEVSVSGGSGTANHLFSVTNTFTLSTATVGTPEPASLALFGLGLAGLGLAGRRKRS